MISFNNHTTFTDGPSSLSTLCIVYRCSLGVELTKSYSNSMANVILKSRWKSWLQNYRQSFWNYFIANLSTLCLWWCQIVDAKWIRKLAKHLQAVLVYELTWKWRW